MHAVGNLRRYAVPVRAVSLFPASLPGPLIFAAIVCSVGSGFGAPLPPIVPGALFWLAGLLLGGAVIALAALAEADLIVFCPSNPYLSIDPVLSIPHLRRAISNAKAPKVAVTPIVGGKAIKGPAAKMMREMSVPINPATVANRYQDLLTGFVLDQQDADWRAEIDMPVLVTDTMMTSLEVKRTLAREIITFAEQLQAARFSEHFFA